MDIVEKLAATAIKLFDEEIKDIPRSEKVLEESAALVTSTVLVKELNMLLENVDLESEELLRQGCKELAAIVKKDAGGGEIRFVDDNENGEIHGIRTRCESTPRTCLTVVSTKDIRTFTRVVRLRCSFLVFPK